MLTRSNGAPQISDAAEVVLGFTHGFATVNGTRLHFVVGCEGQLIALLHGRPFMWMGLYKEHPLPTKAAVSGT